MNLLIPLKIWQQMQYYARLSLPNEITGIGTIKADEALSEFTVTELFLPDQLVSPDTSNFKECALNFIIDDLVQKDPSRAKELRFRWHSHGNGPVFYSLTDLMDIESWEASWVVNMVINARGEFLVRLDIFQPRRLRNIKLDTQIIFPNDSWLLGKCAADISKHVEAIGGNKIEPVF